MRGLLDFSAAFPDEQSCIAYFEKVRWGDKVVSPFDKNSKVYKRKDGMYRCKNTGKNFDVKTGTVFANTKLPLRYWFYAMFLFISHKRAVSSCQLARDLGVTQKTAWNMLNKLREYMDCENGHQLEGEVEIDETFVGGKNKNRHKDKKVEKCQGRSFKDKVPVFGMIQRDGKLVAKTVSDTKAKTLEPLIKKHIKKGSIVFTDGWEYGNMKADYTQMSVDHGAGFYGTTIVDMDTGEVTKVNTNSIENAWTHLKRTIFGTYYHISRKHMQKYVDEFTFRFNTRKSSDIERFDLLLQNVA